MRLIDSSSTGHANRELPRLFQRLSGFMASWSNVYVGATSNPERRLGDHEFDWKWSKMELIYATSSLGSARLVERALIDHARSVRLRCEVANKLPGGEGLVDGAGYYAIYLLLEGRRRRPQAPA